LISYLFICLLVQFSCVDEITFENQAQAGLLVVEGTIHDGNPPYYIRLGITTDNRNVPIPIDDAVVMIHDNEGNSESFVPVNDGLYRLEGEVVYGKRGRYYHIEIELSDGRNFHSTPEMIPIQTPSGSIRPIPGRITVETASGGTRRARVVNVYADTEFPGSSEEQFFSWKIEGVYAFWETPPSRPIAPIPEPCYVSEIPDPQRINLHQKIPGPDLNLTNQLVAVKRIEGHEFYVRYYFNLIYYAISERRFRYWQKVDELINQSGTIFDIPPANIPGNISNSKNPRELVLGYFQSTATDTVRTFLTRADLNFNLTNPCDPINPSPHFGCNGCTRIENSTHERPHYF
jgi:hypothetical protein